MDIDLTDQIQLRFVAEDTTNPGDSGSGGSIIEAALDDFTISIFENEDSIFYSAFLWGKYYLL